MSTAAPEFVDYFAILGLSTTATEEEIGQRIKEELRLWVKRTEAPDMAMRQQAERRVKDLTDAKRTLLDKDRRARYEQELRSRPPAPAGDAAAESVTEDPVEVARRHLAMGDAASAVYVARRATERQSGNPEAWAVLAEGKLLLGRSDDALYEYRKAIDIRPNHAPYYAGLASVQESRRDWRGALQSYEMASRIEPSEVFFRVGIGAVLVQAGEATKALEILRRARNDAPGLEVVNRYLAIALHDAAFDLRTPLRDGSRVITTADQASRSQTMIAEAQGLNFDDPELRASLAHAMDQIRYAQDPHWSYPVGRTVKVALGWLFAAFFIMAASPALGVILLLSIGVWIYFGRKPGHKIVASRTAALQVR